MAVWWRTLFFPLLLLSLSCAYPSYAAPSGQQRASPYRNFLTFTRSIRAHVQHLLRRYKEQQLGDRHFEDRNLEMSSLPSLSTNFLGWLQQKDWERLTGASRDLNTYWSQLDRKRKQMEMEKERTMMSHGSKAASRNPPTLPQSFSRIQREISDLVNQVNFQLRFVKVSPVSTTSPPKLTGSATPPASTAPPQQTLWLSRLEGYVILRDLERYLVKLTRDFLLLASKQTGGSHSEG
ncbi:uncharacterized protein LOC124488015 [Hypomesus transpacificus]|uniref:uncharacterized protein LOC124488015 n=1 Tax=Hypomesus transpacificus TaxID=137520 RepID=UPI001F07A0EC|nr:uncharacterized protein LOC124488015 [Hypomesus transpacificus]